MTNLGTGLSSSIGWAQESSFNTATTPTRWLPHDSETVKRVKKVTQGMGLRAGNLTPFATQRRIATREAKGNVILDVTNQGFGLLLQNMLGTSTNTSSGAAYTQTHTIGSLLGKSLTMQVNRPSVDGNDNPFTYSGGKVIDWEFSLADNQLLKANLGLDFADEQTLGNSPTISSITQTGAAGAVTYYYRVSANYYWGESGASAELSTATSNATLGVSNYNVVTWGAMTGALSYNVYRGSTSGSELKIASGIAGPTYSDQSNTAGSGAPYAPLMTTPSYTSSAAPFSFTMANTLTLGGSAVAAVKKFTVKPLNPSKVDRFYLGSAGVKAEQVGNGYREVTGTIEAEFVSRAALYDAYEADTSLSFVFKVAGDLIATTTTPYSVEIDIPAMKLDGDTPNIKGPDILTQTVPFVGLYDGTNSAIKVIYTTSDTTY